MYTSLCDVRLHYEVSGEGDDIILLHGWGQNIQMMKPIQDYLCKWFRVWNIDLPGSPNSKSSLPPFSWDIYDYAIFLSEFIDKNNIKNPILIGHSFGGRMSIIYSSKNKNIKKMILLSSAGIKHRRNVDYYTKVAFYKVLKRITGFLNDETKKKILDNFGSDDYKNSNVIMKEVLKKVVNEDLQYLMPDIKASTLLIWGENDDATPLSDAKKMNKLIKNSGLVVFPNSGHYAYLENFNKLKSILYSFLVETN